MDEIRYWFLRNAERITWFIIGFMICQGLDDLSRGNYSGAVISFGLAALNYILNRH